MVYHICIGCAVCCAWWNFSKERRHSSDGYFPPQIWIYFFDLKFEFQTCCVGSRSTKMRLLRIRAMRSYASLISLQFFEKLLHCIVTVRNRARLHCYFLCTLETRESTRTKSNEFIPFAFQVYLSLRRGEFYSPLGYVFTLFISFEHCRREKTFAICRNGT